MAPSRPHNHHLVEDSVGLSLCLSASREIPASRQPQDPAEWRSSVPTIPRPMGSCFSSRSCPDIPCARVLGSAARTREVSVREFVETIGTEKGDGEIHMGIRSVFEIGWPAGRVHRLVERPFVEAQRAHLAQTEGDEAFGVEAMASALPDSCAACTAISRFSSSAAAGVCPCFEEACATFRRPRPLGLPGSFWDEQQVTKRRGRTNFAFGLNMGRRCRAETRARFRKASAATTKSIRRDLKDSSPAFRGISQQGRTTSHQNVS